MVGFCWLNFYFIFLENVRIRRRRFVRIINDFFRNFVRYMLGNGLMSLSKMTHVTKNFEI